MTQFTLEQLRHLDLCLTSENLYSRLREIDCPVIIASDFSLYLKNKRKTESANFMSLVLEFGYYSEYMEWLEKYAIWFTYGQNNKP